jgi:hypothetical protein
MDDFSVTGGEVSKAVLWLCCFQVSLVTFSWATERVCI